MTLADKIKVATPAERALLVSALYAFLEHGDAEHRRWLKEALEAFFTSKPRPPVR